LNITGSSGLMVYALDLDAWILLLNAIAQMT